jgi:3-phosphoshikimate 1-carboxyvinyltransferase
MTGGIVVDVPGSKSIANRALVVAALADGESLLTNVPDGDDTAALVTGLGQLGVAVVLDGDRALVRGGGGQLRPGRAARIDARLAGTTSRFLTALAAVADVPVVVDGDAPLRARPMAVLHDALAALGARIVHTEQSGQLPVEVTGPLGGGTVALAGDVSSQFITALMLVGPVLDGGVRIELTTPLVSRPYVALTASVMGAFGAEVEVSERTIVVAQGRYRAREFAVEPDASSASYPMAVAALRAVPVTVAGLHPPLAQGDGAIVGLLEAMGCTVTTDERGTTVARHASSPLVGIDVDMADVSDLVPTVAVVAAAATTPTTVRGVGFIRSKESDRLGDLAAELTRTGADIVETDDGLHVEPVPPGALHGAHLATHHDHRLAMAFAVLATAVPGIDLDEPSVVSKSWPAFWTVWEQLRA